MIYGVIWLLFLLVIREKHTVVVDHPMDLVLLVTLLESMLLKLLPIWIHLLLAPPLPLHAIVELIINAQKVKKEDLFLIEKGFQ